MFGVFRVKNYYFTPKNLIFSNFRGARIIDLNMILSSRSVGNI